MQIHSALTGPSEVQINDIRAAPSFSTQRLITLDDLQSSHQDF